MFSCHFILSFQWIIVWFFLWGGGGSFIGSLPMFSWTKSLFWNSARGLTIHSELQRLIRWGFHLLIALCAYKISLIKLVRCLRSTKSNSHETYVNEIAGLGRVSIVISVGGDDDVKFCTRCMYYIKQSTVGWRTKVLCLGRRLFPDTWK